MFLSPFPESVVFVEVDSASYDPRLSLHPEEKALLHPHASPKRVREFTLGRAAARTALERLGAAPSPVLAGKRGEPIWPEGIVGSISHSDDHAVVAASKAEKYRGIGLDLQSLRRGINEDIARRICHPAELSWCAQGNTANELQLRLLAVFSAKETLFKTLYPLSRAVFYFLDAELRWDNEKQSFRTILLKDLKDVFKAGSEYEIRFVSNGNMILTTLLLA